VNLQKVAGRKKFLELLLEAVNFTGSHLIRRTLKIMDYEDYYCKGYFLTELVFVHSHFFLMILSAHVLVTFRKK